MPECARIGAAASNSMTLTTKGNTGSVNAAVTAKAITTKRKISMNNLTVEGQERPATSTSSGHLSGGVEKNSRSLTQRRLGEDLGGSPGNHHTCVTVVDSNPRSGSSALHAQNLDD